MQLFVSHEGFEFKCRDWTRGINDLLKAVGQVKCNTSHSGLNPNLHLAPDLPHLCMMVDAWVVEAISWLSGRIAKVKRAVAMTPKFHQA